MLSVLMVPPVIPQAVSASHVWPGRLTWTAPEGQVRVVMDTCEFDFHMDVAPDTCTALVAVSLEKMYAMGLEPLDEDECEPELLADGFTRIYLTPVDPVSTTSIGVIMVPESAEGLL